LQRYDLGRLIAPAPTRLEEGGEAHAGRERSADAGSQAPPEVTGQ